MFCILSLLSPYSLPVCACACERGYKITGLWDYVAKQWYNRLRGGCLNLLSVTRETRGCCCPVDGADWRTIIPRHSSEYSILLSHVTPTDQSFVDEPTTVAPPVNIIVHRYYPPTVHYPPTFSLALRRETSFSGSNAVTTLAPLLPRSPYTPLLAGYRHLPSVDPWTSTRRGDTVSPPSGSCRTNSTRRSGSHPAQVWSSGGSSDERVSERRRPDPPRVFTGRHDAGATTGLGGHGSK